MARGALRAALAIMVASACLTTVLADPGATPDATAETKALALTIAKFNAYVAYMNETGGAVSALARYDGWVDARTGPTGRERTIAGIGSASNGGNERTAALKETDADPALPDLDAAIKTFAAADDALVPILNEAHGYYAREDYKLDKMEGARAFHARIMAAGPPLLAARRHLEDVMAVEKRHLDLIALDTIEAKEGRSANWNILSVTTRSKQVVDHFTTATTSHVDMAALDADMALMGTAVKDMDDFSAHHPEASLTTGMSDDLLVDARHLRERLAKVKGDLHRIDRFAIETMRMHYDSMLMVIRPPPVIPKLR